ncbi:MAG: hypothetical protein ACLFWM_03425 [Actinomycetota bacterium]
MSEKPTDGWEPGLSPSDGVLRAYTENYAGEMASFAASTGGRVLRTDRYLLADHGAPAGIFNSAVLLRPAPHDLEDVAAEVTGEFGTAGGGRVYLWSPVPTVDLTGAGWHLEGHPTFAVRPPGGPLPGPSRVRVERVADPARLAEWEEVVVNGFPFGDLQPYRKGALVGEAILDDDRARMWVAYDGDRPGAAAALHLEAGIAGFALGATLPESRRKGLWYALVRTRLLEEPELVAASVFSDDSRPGAEAIGFLPVSRWTLWSRLRGQA